jgi:hypothetical protein
LSEGNKNKQQMKEHRKEYCNLNLDEESALADITVKTRGQNVLRDRGSQKEKTVVL